MPGFHIYTSNRLETLADIFAELLNSTPLPPLQKETILIQSRGMARWLAMETASRLNIWANCDCPFPNTFINSVYKLLLPDSIDLLPYDKEYILWHLMALLPETQHDPHFNKVASYLGSGDDLKLYQLAYETADLFDQYTIFRPEMILEWEKDINRVAAEHAWQAIVWRRLIDRLGHTQQFPQYHRARLMQLFEKKILAPGFDPAALPPRVTLFGISSLPPYHLRILAALSQHIDLHLFVMNPCREYWFDIIADRDIVKISRHEAVGQETLHLKEGNSLLASMGHLGRDFMAMLQELYTEEHDFFSDPGNNSLLELIQQDIFYLREQPGSVLENTPGKTEIADSDASLVFHSCHSPMREVEVLHDHLLDIFNSSREGEHIEPRDILVMAPDIDDYAPLIKAVFDAENHTREKIPYTISDQSIKQTSQYIQAFLDILTVTQSRFKSVDVIAILESEPVKNRFSISETDMTTIEKWIRETKIRWGAGPDHKTRLELPPHRENTWRAGLDRLLLGYAMPGHGQILFENNLPYDQIEGDGANLLGLFLDFAETLFTLAATFQTPHTLAEWSAILLQAKDRLLLADEESAAEDRVLHRLLYRIEDLQNRTFFIQEVSLDVIRSFLESSLSEGFSPMASGTDFLAGGVTFCSMLPMRAIPFKVICLLGMNDGLYPRSGRKRSFDLMAKRPKRGDRSKRYDDRYLFLETILSARKKLSVSFVGQSIQDGSKRPPSVLVSELMDYIDRGYSSKEIRVGHAVSLSESLTIKHRLQPFHPDYFKTHGSSGHENLFSYSGQNCAAAWALTSAARNIVPLFSGPLPSPRDDSKQIELHELVRFFCHPVRYLLLNIVGIAPIDEGQPLLTSEPFTLNGLARYKLEQDILDHLLKNRDCSDLYRIKKAAGELPHGETGKTFFTQLLTELQYFHKTIAKIFPLAEQRELQFTLDIGAYTLCGHLQNVSPKGLLQYRYATMKPQDVIRSWINHLVLNSIGTSAAAPTGTDTFFAAKDSVYKYAPAAESRLHLEQLLDLFLQGLREPLYFFPRSSFVYAVECHKGRSEEVALHRAISAWEGDAFNKRAEKNDPYNLLCCKNMDFSNPLFKEQAKRVFMAALAHQEKLG